MLSFEEVRHQRVTLEENRLRLGERSFALEEMPGLAAPYDAVSVRALADAARPYLSLSSHECQPQAAILLYQLTGQIEALGHYFPLIQYLSDEEKIAFHTRLNQILQDRRFRLRLKAVPAAPGTPPLPDGVGVIIAGHLLEVYFFRPEFLELVLSKRRSFWIYPTLAAYKKAGGSGGGDYHPVLRCIRMPMARLLEGFYGSEPGTTPFLHELGHLLESLNTSWWWPRGNGLLPGLQDDEYLDTEAQALFLAGKNLEAERYRLWQKSPLQTSIPQPVGSTYLFQNDHEFIAGYLEMFFRNPHHFARQNITLYRAFERLIGWNPRQVRQKDFASYIEANQKEYAEGSISRQHGLT